MGYLGFFLASAIIKQDEHLCMDIQSMYQGILLQSLKQKRNWTSEPENIFWKINAVAQNWKNTKSPSEKFTSY